MEWGLYVEYDGKKNIVLSSQDVKEYPIGGLICEYARLQPTELKEVIVRNPYFVEKDLAEKAPNALYHFYNELAENYGVVVAGIIGTEFANCFQDYICCDKSELIRMVKDYNNKIEEDCVKQFILENSGFKEFGKETVGQAFLTTYATFASSYAVFKHIFNHFVTDTYEDEHADKILSLYGENVNFQHIAFNLMLYDGRFHSVYSINSGISLILFEIAHILDNQIKIVKCKNCNNYFVPVGRSDMIYCGYPAPQDKTKACRDIGSKITRIKIMKNDLVIMEYRRLYMRLMMRVKRHPSNMELQEQLNIFKTEMKILRKKREDGLVSSDDILEWLNSIDAKV